MATREQSGTTIDPGLIARVVAGVRYAVSGVTPTSWFGPAQPLAPQAQDAAVGRAFDYPVGYNLRIQPRSEEAISFAALRGLADGYDLLRLVIETRKDQIASFDWEIVPADKDAAATGMTAEVDRVTAFLQRPNREHNWAQWLRQVVEELLVIDAVCVYPRMTRGGDLYGLELVDGATIKRVLDDTGRTPMPPDPAYQQILKGIPAVDYSSDDLIYTMRNPRVSRIYGLSPVEQVITTVNIAVRRQLSQLNFYTEGNIPEALAQVPETWTAKQVAEFQLWWDQAMEGNQAARRKMRFMPSLENIVFPKDAVLKDEMDEWLARIVCFAFSISPSALIKQVNRASGEQMADTAKEEGLMPLLRFIESFLSYLIQRYMGAPGLRFSFRIVNRVDPKAQADIHGIYITNQVMTPDEVREDLELDALTPEEREAAFPAPAPPQALGPDGLPLPPPADGQGADGKPLAGAAAATAAAAAEAPPAKPEGPTEAEKMLADALRMLDPQRLAKAIEQAATSQAPRVVELRPEVNVEVGDNVVHLPVNVTQKADKPPPPRVLRATRQADGSMLAKWEETQE